MKRPRLRTCVLLGVLGVLLALAGAAYLVSQREGVTVAAFYERLTVGMTEAEVGAAVPIPPGDYTGGDVHTTSRPTCEGGLPIYIDYCTRADGTLAGSAIDMATAVRNCVRLLRLSLPDAIRLATDAPARFLGQSAMATAGEVSSCGSWTFS